MHCRSGEHDSGFRYLCSDLKLGICGLSGAVTERKISRSKIATWRFELLQLDAGAAGLRGWRVYLPW